jgi:hypothetical protein
MVFYISVSRHCEDYIQYIVNYYGVYKLEIKNMIYSDLVNELEYRLILC